MTLTLGGNTMILSEVSDQLAEEIRDGRWKHIPDLAVKPVPVCEEIIQNLQRRCPGDTRQDYRTTVAKGLSESR
ncbi:MAG: hypothetical protein RL693_904 [Verrucomicrobiota bacterium]|jgi:hypothetical protein